MSMEFLTLYTPSEHNQPLDDLRKVVTPYYPDIMNRSNKTFWQRKVSAHGPFDRSGTSEGGGQGLSALRGGGNRCTCTDAHNKCGIIPQSDLSHTLLPCCSKE
jgi:hypothetical protein